MVVENTYWEKDRRGSPWREMSDRGVKVGGQHRMLFHGPLANEMTVKYD